MSADDYAKVIEASRAMEPGRAEFEAWLVTQGWIVAPATRECGSYVNGQAQARWLGWQAAWNSQQAIIDRLMLEHCPDEMTPHQMAEWAKHQAAALTTTADNQPETGKE